MKRIISVILSLAMILSYMPAMAFATDDVPASDEATEPVELEEQADAPEEIVEEQVPVVANEEFYEGEDGGFDGDGGYDDGYVDEEPNYIFIEPDYYEDHEDDVFYGHIPGEEVELPDMTIGDIDGVKFEWYTVEIIKDEDGCESSVPADKPFLVTDTPSITATITAKHHNFQCVAERLDEDGNVIQRDNAWYHFDMRLALPTDCEKDIYVTPGQSAQLSVDLGAGVQVLDWNKVLGCEYNEATEEEEYIYEPIAGIKGASVAYKPDMGDSEVACRVKCVEDGEEIIEYVHFNIHCSYVRSLELSCSPENCIEWDRPAAFVEAGETATIEANCDVDPEVPVEYQWYVSRDDYPYPPEWVWYNDSYGEPESMDDFVAIDGANSSVLEITPDKSVYVKCVVTSCYNGTPISVSEDAYIWAPRYYGKNLTLDDDVAVVSSEGYQYVTFTAPETGYYVFSAAAQGTPDPELKPLISYIKGNYSTFFTRYYDWDEEAEQESEIPTYPSFMLRLNQNEEFKLYVTELGGIDGEQLERTFALHAEYIGDEYECDHETDYYCVGRVEPTCTEPGCSGDLVCTMCGEVVRESRELPAEHMAKKLNVRATCDKPGTSGRCVCSVCGEVLEEGVEVPALGHKYGTAKVTKAATALAKGMKVSTCERCGGTKSTSIAKLTPTIKLSAKSKKIKKRKSYKLKISNMAKGDYVKSVKANSRVKIKKISKTCYKITGKKRGKAKVTVTLASGKKAVCKVTVK